MRSSSFIEPLSSKVNECELVDLMQVNEFDLPQYKIGWYNAWRDMMVTFLGVAPGKAESFRIFAAFSATLATYSLPTG